MAAGAGHRVPAAVRQNRPCRVAGHLAEQPEHLGVAGRPVAPAVAVALDQLRPVLRVGVRDQEAIRARLVAAHHIRGAGQRKLGQVGPAGRVTHGGQRQDNAQGAVRDVMKRAGVPTRTSQCTPPAVGRLCAGTASRPAPPGRDRPTDKAPSAIPALPPGSWNWSADVPVETGADDLQGMIRGELGGGIPSRLLTERRAKAMPVRPKYSEEISQSSTRRRWRGCRGGRLGVGMRK